MEAHRVIVKITILLLVGAIIFKIDVLAQEQPLNNYNETEIFQDVYNECLVRLSFPCVQRKTLIYLKQLNNLSEVSIVGDYVKFVRVNTSQIENIDDDNEINTEINSEDLTKLINQAIDRFFNNHVIKFSAMGRDILIPNNVEEFVGRKKHKGGGMMSGNDAGHFGHKKMMMMAMMCMKMKMMMMIPAMMGMMGMMSFKGMMFSMMSFMISKMMLLMKILEKKGGLGGPSTGGGGADGGWAAGGGSGGAWMPAGAQDFGAGGGYDANGQWQSRSIIENKEIYGKKPAITPILSYSNPIKMNNIATTREDYNKINKNTKSRRKRSIVDVLQNSYMYFMNKILGNNNNRRISNVPKYKYVNGVKYVYYPYPYRQLKMKMPKEIQVTKTKNINEEIPVIVEAGFNKGEIMEGAVESRMIRKKFQKMKDKVNETLDDNPWQ